MHLLPRGACTPGPGEQGVKADDRWALQASRGALGQYLRGGPRGKTHGQVVGNHRLAELTVRVAASAGIWFPVTPP